MAKLSEVEDFDRYLGTYFRVGFYGKRFGERNGVEFIYKKPKITLLAEVSVELKELYSKQLGVPVRTLPDSGPVDRAALDPNDCVLQVTFVKPFFTPEEEKARVTFIERNSSITKFTFSTPFTKEGRGQTADLAEQYKLVTVLHVTEPFPFLTTAQRVVRREETTLSPIRAAVEDVEVRTEQILEVVNQEARHSRSSLYKTLTGILAGSVSPQVNAGAAQIARAFLARREGDPLPDAEMLREQRNLRSGLRSFLAACDKGIDLNRELTKTLSEVERRFHQTLETNYRELCAAIEPLLREPRTERKAKNLKTRFSTDSGASDGGSAPAPL